MADFTEYLQQLETALIEKHTELERQVLPGLKDNLRSFQSAFSSIHKLLMDKGLLQSDPYKYEQKTDLSPPSADPFTESEALREISFRMTSYGSALDYANNFFHISADSLELPVIKRLLNLVQYIRFSDFSPNSSLIMTRSVSTMLEKVKALNDDMSNLVITSALGQLRDRTKEIKGALKKISLYQRERYKFKVRSMITSQIDTLNESTYREGKNEALLAIKVEFPTRMMDTPFYKELIQELLEEDYGDNKESLRSMAMHNLEVKKSAPQKKKVEKQFDVRKDLMKLLSLLASCSTQLSSCYSKLENNHRALFERKKSFGEALSYWLKNVFGSKKKGDIYELKVVDPMTSLKKNEIINYQNFTDALMGRIQSLRNLDTKTSALFLKLKEASEKQLFKFVEDSIHDIRSYHKRLEGFERFYKSITEKEIKPKIKSMKVDCDTLKYQIGTVTRTMSEVSATVEEEKQLKALGIEEA